LIISLRYVASGRDLVKDNKPSSNPTKVVFANPETHNEPEALSEVQRAWLVKLRKEHGLLPAVKLASPFIMGSQGKP
jgi:hypothetical protein